MSFLAQLPLSSTVFLALALGLALAFEFVNGFHDTANAVATVIYTHALRPYVAVVWSGVWNLIGVLTSSGGVAFSIVALLPAELVINVGSSAGFAMVFALLLSAMIWNVGTWYLGLPASSSHTLIGAIMGVGMANAAMNGHAFGEGINWGKAREVGMSLVLSPLAGFIVAGLLLILAKALIRRPELYTAPEKDKAPPLWVRGLLILTCTGVSFAHGSNDGQKGMGLLMLILVGIIPGTYALKMDACPKAIQGIVAEAHAASATFEKHAAGVSMPPADARAELQSYMKPNGKPTGKTFGALLEINSEIIASLGPLKSFSELSESDRRATRTGFYLAAGSIGKLLKGNTLAAGETAALDAYKGDMDKFTKFIPPWVKVAVACALGLGTMIGWKRIVVTVGEKIGKSHLSYGQGAAAELVAMGTILAADHYNLPVSTTHVLSSGVAGTMAANHSGLQMETLRNLLLAWVLTLPVCVFLGATLFAAGLYIVLHTAGLHP